MRTWIPILITLSSCAVESPAQETPTDPSEVLRKLERRLEETKSIRVEFRGEAKDSGNIIPYSGTLLIKSGGKLRWQWKMTHGAETIESRVKSDGTQVRIEGAAEWKRLESCPKGFTRFAMRGITRMGLFEFGYVLGRIGEGSEERSQDWGEIPQALRLSAGEGTLEYVFAYQTGGKPFERGKATLWLDPKTHLPLKRSSDYRKDDPMFVFTETYEKISTDEIPDSEFRLD